MANLRFMLRASIDMAQTQEMPVDYRSGFTSPTKPARSPRRLLGTVGAVALAVALLPSCGVDIPF